MGQRWLTDKQEQETHASIGRKMTTHEPLTGVETAYIKGMPEGSAARMLIYEGSDRQEEMVRLWKIRERERGGGIMTDAILSTLTPQQQEEYLRQLQAEDERRQDA